LLNMSAGWTSEYDEFPSYTDEFGNAYGGTNLNAQYVPPQASYLPCDESFGATTEPYAGMFPQSGSSVTLDHVSYGHTSTSTSTVSWTQAGSSSSSTQANITALNEPSPPQAESDASGSENAATQHEWVQTGTVTSTRLLSHLVIEELRDSVKFFFCGVEGCTHPSGFPHKSQLVTHIRSVHLQEKPFLCITCRTPFARKQEAIRHVNTANSGRRYECNICGKTFARKNYRDSHRDLCLQRRAITTTIDPRGGSSF